MYRLNVEHKDTERGEKTKKREKKRCPVLDMYVQLASPCMTGAKIMLLGVLNLTNFV